MTDRSAFYAGAASGCTVRFITQPLDVLKIRFQLQIEPISNFYKQSYYRSLTHAIKRICVEEGVLGLWKGHIPAQYLSIVFGAVQFQTFEMLYSKTKRSKMSSYDLLFGGISGVSACLCCHPIDVIRTRLSSQGCHKTYKGSIDAVRHIILEEGFYGFFRGLVPSLLLIFPQTAIQFFIYHSMRNELSASVSKDKTINPVWSHNILVFLSQDPYKQLVSGSLAGVIAKILIYPLDLAKRRLQVQGFEDARLPFGKFHKSLRMLHSLQKTILEEGMLGLYKGIVPSSIKAGVVSSLTFYFFEQFKEIF